MQMCGMNVKYIGSIWDELGLFFYLVLYIRQTQKFRFGLYKKNKYITGKITCHYSTTI